MMKIHEKISDEFVLPSFRSYLQHAIVEYESGAKSFALQSSKEDVSKISALRDLIATVPIDHLKQSVLDYLEQSFELERTWKSIFWIDSPKQHRFVMTIRDAIDRYFELEKLHNISKVQYLLFSKKEYELSYQEAKESFAEKIKQSDVKIDHYESQVQSLLSEVSILQNQIKELKSNINTVSISDLDENSLDSYLDRIFKSDAKLFN